MLKLQPFQSKLRPLLALALVASATLASVGAKAAQVDEACDAIATFLLGFQLGLEPGAEKGLHAFPAVPSVVAGNVDRETMAKINGYYDRYVLLERSIQDIWKERYARNPSAEARKRYASERAAIHLDMNRTAKAAKDEMVRYAFRARNCFESYEALVVNQHAEMGKSLAAAKATLKANEEIWAHAEAEAAALQPNAPTPVAPTVGGADRETAGRAPASR